MAEILKISSPVEVKNRIHDMPKQRPADAIFDLARPEDSFRDSGKIAKAEDEGHRQELLKNLNKEIMLPLHNETKAQVDSIRKLVLYAKLFEVSTGTLTLDFMDRFFLLSKELLAEILEREESSTVFRGDFFDALRVLMKNGSGPKLQETILAILKYFDCHVSREHSFQSVLSRSRSLADLLTKQDSQSLKVQTEILETNISKEEDYNEVLKFLKNEFIPVLRSIASNYSPKDKVYDVMLSIIHYIVRYDKGDPRLLENAFLHFAEELRPLYPHLTGDDIADMKESLFRDARTAKGDAEILTKENDSLFIKEEKNMAELLNRALDKDSPAKISSIARGLLMSLVQSESPMLPLLHFMIPLRFMGEDTYGEFFIDKECKGRKEEAKRAANIFFTIQSDVYGTFEVDILAKDNSIELDIKCPKELIRAVKETGPQFKDLAEASGYRMTTYQVGEYKASLSIMNRFPDLADRKAGIDVRI